MRLDGHKFLPGQLGGLVEDAVRHGQLAEVVQVGGDAHHPVGLLVKLVVAADFPNPLADAARMGAGKRRLGVDNPAEYAGNAADLAVIELPADLRQHGKQRAFHEHVAHPKPEFDPTAQLFDGFADIRVEKARVPAQGLQNLVAVQAFGIQHRDGVRHGDDSRIQRNLVPGKAEGPAAVEMLVMVQNDALLRAEKREGPYIFFALDTVLRVCLHGCFRRLAGAGAFAKRAKDAVVVQQGIGNQVEKRFVRHAQLPRDAPGDIGRAYPVAGVVGQNVLLGEIQCQGKGNQQFVHIKQHEITTPLLLLSL